jgi:hypothetical protein
MGLLGTNVSDTECLRHSWCPLEWPPDGCLRSLDAYGPTWDSLGGAGFSARGLWEMPGKGVY